MSMQYWLIKSEPFKYSFAQLVHDGKTVWDGIRNFEARNNLRAMKVGDLCLFYHSNEGKEVVGIAVVAREAFPDPTTTEDFSAVEVAPQRALAHPVGLDAMREHPVLQKMMIFRRQRLSVVPVTPEEFDSLVALGDSASGAGGKNAKPAAKPKASAKKPKRAAVPQAAATKTKRTAAPKSAATKSKPATTPSAATKSKPAARARGGGGGGGGAKKR
jgi:predicted RNA-binding protein with PUA-like domain